MHRPRPRKAKRFNYCLKTITREDQQWRKKESNKRLGKQPHKKMREKSECVTESSTWIAGSGFARWGSGFRQVGRFAPRDGAPPHSMGEGSVWRRKAEKDSRGTGFGSSRECVNTGWEECWFGAFGAEGIWYLARGLAPQGGNKCGLDQEGCTGNNSPPPCKSMGRYGLMCWDGGKNGASRQKYRNILIQGVKGGGSLEKAVWKKTNSFMVTKVACRTEGVTADSWTLHPGHWKKGRRGDMVNTFILFFRNLLQPE